MASVMIGIDPDKASHTAVAISAAEERLGKLRVRASAAEAGLLLEWAAAWPERTWAVEGAGGMGHLLVQQLLAAGERVLDVQFPAWLRWSGDDGPAGPLVPCEGVQAAGRVETYPRRQPMAVLPATAWPALRSGLASRPS